MASLDDDDEKGVSGSAPISPSPSFLAAVLDAADRDAHTIPPWADQRRVRTLNVGGTRFQALESTLTRQAKYFCAALWYGTDQCQTRDEALFIDRDPALFQHVLGYLREPGWAFPDDERTKANLRLEMAFFQVEPMPAALVPLPAVVSPRLTPVVLYSSAFTVRHEIETGVASERDTQFVIMRVLSDMSRVERELQRRCGFEPIQAHAERYPSIMYPGLRHKYVLKPKYGYTVVSTFVSDMCNRLRRFAPDLVHVDADSKKRTSPNEFLRDVTLALRVHVPEEWIGGGAGEVRGEEV